MHALHGTAAASPPGSPLPALRGHGTATLRAVNSPVTHRRRSETSPPQVTALIAGNSPVLRLDRREFTAALAARMTPGHPGSRPASRFSGRMASVARSEVISSVSAFRGGAGPEVYKEGVEVDRINGASYAALALMAIPGNDHPYSSPHLVLSSSEWGSTASARPSTGRDRPLVQCPGHAVPSSGPSASLTRCVSRILDRPGGRATWAAGVGTAPIRPVIRVTDRQPQEDGSPRPRQSWQAEARTAGRAVRVGCG